MVGTQILTELPKSQFQPTQLLEYPPTIAASLPSAKAKGEATMLRSLLGKGSTT